MDEILRVLTSLFGGLTFIMFLVGTCSFEQAVVSLLLCILFYEKK